MHAMQHVLSLSLFFLFLMRCAQVLGGGFPFCIRRVGDDLSLLDDNKTETEVLLEEREKLQPRPERPSCE